MKQQVLMTDPELLLQTLNAIIPFLQDVGFGQPSYGFFYGGDPNRFTPDDEATEEEYSRWKADCEAYTKGEKGPTPASCSMNDEPMVLPDREGKPVEYQPGQILLTKSFYGTGINLNPDHATHYARLVDLQFQLRKTVGNETHNEVKA